MKQYALLVGCSLFFASCGSVEKNIESSVKNVIEQRIQKELSIKGPEAVEGMAPYRAKYDDYDAAIKLLESSAFPACATSDVKIRCEEKKPGIYLVNFELSEPESSWILNYLVEWDFAWRVISYRDSDGTFVDEFQWDGKGQMEVQVYNSYWEEVGDSYKEWGRCDGIEYEPLRGEL